MAYERKTSSRYWCKFCHVSIQDNRVSRESHEASSKHRTAVRQNLQDIQRRGAEQQREAARNEAALIQITAAAERAYARETGQRLASAAPTPSRAPAALAAAAATADPAAAGSAAAVPPALSPAPRAPPRGKHARPEAPALTPIALSADAASLAAAVPLHGAPPSDASPLGPWVEVAADPAPLPAAAAVAAAAGDAAPAVKNEDGTPSDVKPAPAAAAAAAAARPATISITGTRRHARELQADDVQRLAQAPEKVVRAAPPSGRPAPAAAAAASGFKRRRVAGAPRGRPRAPASDA
ncbi:hypothetical protein CXG81DRAFT_24202 [Caulochytrium protostelioides]|uniref:U1-type domain-containing protein n=1 Tax=Caulochytrium protostelioides TaxID=1555241 RepID=A0A4P9XDH9_9FUNG|nr:hypothetical protein CXG81DRAFT_24202 [Caulochytrium protostelioides]|eukprot:RKP03201.1 hypothetical protein CXG81DRAFT_24202 [Caulochytrium protostelioides]